MRRKDREITDLDEIEAILRQCKTCHIAMVDDGLPYVVPVSYGYSILNRTLLELYFHSAPEGRKLDVWKRNNKVCFEVSCEGEPVHAETPCNSGYYFASVIGYGEVTVIHDIKEKCKALSVLCKHHTGREAAFTADQAKNVCVFKIVSANFTGKRKPRPTA